MPCQLIDGKAIARKIRREIKEEVDRLRSLGIVPGLTVVLVGEDPGSLIYVANKEKACREIGIYSEVIRLRASTAEDELLEIVHRLNVRDDVHGILVQLPLPGHINEERVLNSIHPAKDVDGYHPLNMGALMLGIPGLRSCTPLGCMQLIESTGYALEGKRAVVVGRSNNVGKPMALLLLKENATVTVCHSRTKSLRELTLSADVLVVAVGKPGIISGEMIKPGALVLDVGMNRMPDGKLKGDVEFSSAQKTAGWITPVPGGVGPMTIAMLMLNTLKAATTKAATS